MKVKFILIFGFLIVIISFLSVKYADYKQLKSDKMLKVYSSLDRIISEYFNKYWDIPDKENIRTFIENRKDAGEDKNIIDCLNYPGLKIIPDSSDNNVLIKLFSENNSIFSENAIILSNMNFFDFLLKREIFISQQPIDDLCSYFSFKFFSKGEPYENTMLKKKIHELLINSTSPDLKISHFYNID